MTWVSERSGIASTGMWRSVYTPYATTHGGRQQDQEPILRAEADDRPRIMAVRRLPVPAGTAQARTRREAGERAAFRLDSESSRKLAEVTTRSPSRTPDEDLEAARRS